ncbi:MAG TPA: hypothetical protein VE978_28315 [Chitinophagales bacterium]|nr:hypothetical protein [Chitinophagales bacterium]
MQLLIDVKTEKDKKLFSDLADRLHLQSTEISLDDMEDFALANAIKEGRKSKTIDKNKFMTRLRKRIEAQ